MSDSRSVSLRFLVPLVLSIVCLAAPAWADFKAGEKAANQEHAEAPGQTGELV